MGKGMQGDTIYGLLAVRIRRLLEMSRIQLESLQEIRMRAGNPLLLKYRGTEYILTEHGEISRDIQNACIVTKEEVEETLEYISGYSLYAFSEEIKQGFITVPGGHRVGLAGKIVTEGSRISCIRHISFINIRLAHQIPGCADRVMPYLISKEGLCNTLILSPPGCGKTTLLRDIIRQISDGTEKLPGMTVGVVDERSELAGSYLGIPQNDLGIRTDVLDCCPKYQGMMMLLRSMSPQVIAVDEIGGQEDMGALQRVRNCGCQMIASMHGDSFGEVVNKSYGEGVKIEQIFQRFIILGGRPVGTVREIVSSDGEILYQGTGGDVCGFR
ncbi:MAG: stage III sporulation protein AA [Lachnospiraceae bacterium]|nr:stage III sporulation protein AA [Lachnospiraceae bacterium]